MKILHICLASHYTEDMTYQDNQLSDQNAKDGHDVVVVSDCFAYKGSELIEVPEEDRLLPSGVRLVRFKYDRIINSIISSKIRRVRRLKKFIDEYKPDVILFHGAAGWEMKTVGEYKKKNPKIKLYIDCHADIHNSGTFWISKFFQYRVFNRILIYKIKKFVDKFFYISYESKDFLTKIYDLSEDSLEFYPLGGNIVSLTRKRNYKKSIRLQHNLKSTDIVILHTGKLTPSKKTKELINAFSCVKDQRLKLILIGSISNSIRTVLNTLINQDNRIMFLGWKSGEELIQYICAADLYFQPGTQSATMQNVICCGVPVALYPFQSHKPYLNKNGFYVESQEDYVNVLTEISKNTHVLDRMSEASYKIANSILDYRKLAARLYI